MVFHCIFLGKRRSLLHQNTAQGSFFPLQSYSKKTLRKNVPKNARKYKRNELMPPEHPIILLKSNLFNMAAASVKRSVFLSFFPRWKRFLCGPQLFVKLRSQQSKQSSDSFFLVCSTDKSFGLSIKGTSVCTRTL